jgi:coproporphyrinogen III oxidase
MCIVEVTLPGDRTVWWYGGGSDLTPTYPNEADAIHFHQTIKDTCDKFDPAWYPRFKNWADTYYVNKARKEARGVGGIFFDDFHDGTSGGEPKERIFQFVTALAQSLPKSYFPIVQKHKGNQLQLRVKVVA